MPISPASSSSSCVRLRLAAGRVTQLAPAAMANLLGDLWKEGEPDWEAAAAIPNVKIHLYGKLKPRPGRKMGHLTALADDVEQALADVQARTRLAETVLSVNCTAP